jgi:hypothetical protein
MLRHTLGAGFCLTSGFLLIWNAVQHDSLSADEQIGIVGTSMFSFTAGMMLLFL